MKRFKETEAKRFKKNDRENRKKGLRWSIFSKLVLILMMLAAGAFMSYIPLVDAFPNDLLMIILATLFTLLVVAAIFLFRKKKPLRAIGVILALAFIATCGAGTYYMANTYAMFNSIVDSNHSSTVNPSGVDVAVEPFNIYITGIDQWNEDKGYDLERSDVNLIVTVNPSTRKILMTSIPRDSYVPLHRTGTMDKLTHTGIYGVDETLNTVEGWLGIKLNYYVKVNFDACVDLVDAIGGIDIYNPVEFRSHLNNHLYPKGDIHVKGRGALYYARERHAFEDADEARVQNQQRVLKAILKKVMTSSTLLTSYGDIMSVLGHEIETNMPASDMQILIRQQLSNMSEWDISSQRITGEYDMDTVASLSSANVYSVLKVNPDSQKSCEEGIEKIMNPTEAELEEAKAKQTKSFIDGMVKRILVKQTDEEAEE